MLDISNKTDLHFSQFMGMKLCVVFEHKIVTITTIATTAMVFQKNVIFNKNYLNQTGIANSLG